MHKQQFYANAILAEESLAEKIAKEEGISYPSNHLAIFIASLNPLDEPNNNGVILTAEANKKFLTTIHQAQVNFSHIGAWFVCGAVIKEWIDEETKEVKIAFTFYKDLYTKEYTKALESQAKGTLGVSFELTAEMDTVEKIDAKNMKIHDFEYTGVGLLGVIDNKKPAYDKGLVSVYAQDLRDKVLNASNRELIFAEAILKTCDEILKEEETYIVSEKEISEFVSEMQDKLKKKKNKNWKNKYSENLETVESQKGGKIMSEEQKKLVAAIRSELEGFIPAETTDEQLLDEKIVASYREAKATKANESEAKTTAETKPEVKPEGEVVAAVEPAKVSAESKHLSVERYITLTTYKDDGAVETKSSKECTYSYLDSEGKTQTETITEDRTSNRVYAEDEVKAIETKASEAEEKLKASESKVTELEATIASQKTELDVFKAEKVAKETKEATDKLNELKASLKDNKYVADFKDEDYLNAEKVEKAKTQEKIDRLEAENEELKKSGKIVAETKPIKKAITTGNDTEAPKKDPRSIIRKVFASKSNSENK